MGDQAYCIGGGGSSAQSSSCRMYDLSENAWTSKTSMTYARYAERQHGAGGYEDGMVGGYNESTKVFKTEKYDISGNSWSTKVDYPRSSGEEGTRYHIAGYVYFCQTKYDLANDVYRSGGYGKQGGGYTGAFKIGSIIYDFQYSTLMSASSSSLDVDSDSTTMGLTNFSTRVNGANSASDDGGAGYGFIFGGRPPGGTGTWSTTNNQRYDQSGGTWAARTALGSKTMKGGTFAIDGDNHTIAGREDSAPYTTLNYNGRYDNDANSWTTKTAYPEPGAGVCGFFQPDNFPPSAPTGLSVSVT